MPLLADTQAREHNLVETGVRLRSARPGSKLEVLLVEDNEDDVELTRIGLEQTQRPVRLHHAGNGEECLAFLRKQGRYADAPNVDLVLLDLNMPRMDGREVLEAVNSDDGLRHLPIVVMTSSVAERDVLDSYRLRCNSYVVKPIEFSSFVALMNSITDYWFATSVLPSRAAKYLSTTDNAPSSA
jgi:two-component system response regulator